MRGWQVLTATVAAFAVAGTPAHACAGAHVTLSATNAAKVRRATMCLLNQRRRRAGLRRLKPNAKLVIAATAHSQDMVAEGYFAHDGPHGDTFVTRATSAGYLTGHEHAWGLAENLAYGAGGKGSAAVIVKEWMASPVHRANVLSETARDAGVGLWGGTPFGDTDGATFTLDLGYVH